MTIERARVLPHARPWGVADLRPWSMSGGGAELVGELSYERTDDTAPATALLLKLLFTGAPLSVQVHPDDKFAKSIGLPNGKSEVWYVLKAAPGAKVGIGLKTEVTRQQLQRAIKDASILDHLDWLPAKAADVFVVDAGTIHAIGAGLVIAEIQQRSDATFRLFDYGRDRALHVEIGTAAAHLASRHIHVQSEPLSKQRRVLASNSHFVFEQLALEAGSAWRLDAARETWLLVVDGDLHTGSHDLTSGNAIFAAAESVDVQVGAIGADCLVAYTGHGGPNPRLLQRISRQYANAAWRPIEGHGSGPPIGHSQ